MNKLATSGLRSAVALGVARRSLRRFPRVHPPRRVLHLSPAFFGEKSVIGGGERWAVNAAKALAEKVESRFITFGAQRESFMLGALQVEVYPQFRASDPNAWSFLEHVRWADVVQCHQYRAAATSMLLIAAAFAGKETFVTEHGARSHGFPGDADTEALVDAFLHVSKFSESLLPGRRSFVVYGGVDDVFLEPRRFATVPGRVLFVGRLLPHKGVNYLVEAITSGMQLELYGRPYDPKFFELLQRLSAGKNVTFTTDGDDADLVRAYQEAVVTVLPSVYIDVNGAQQTAPELLGLVLLESMACGTPVIATDVGAMPEIVEEGVTGFIVPPNDPTALRERLEYLVANPDVAKQMGENARRRVAERFTWRHVADACWSAYNEVAQSPRA